MDYIINMVYYILPFIILLGILVFVHEFGHFIVARLCGVKVSAFSIGFGKTLWSRTDKHGTVWQIAAIPLGGYCQFLGDADASSSTSEEQTVEMSEEDKKHAFVFQPTWKKLAIVCAGPFANYFFAIFIFTGIFFFMGNIVFPPVIDGVIENSPAERANLQKGDRILSINGHHINDFNDITVEVSMSVDGHAELEILRNGETISVPLELEELEVEGSDGKKERKPMIGVRSVSSYEISNESFGLLKSIWLACQKTWSVNSATLRGVKQMIVGTRSSEELGGIIRIAEMSGDISKEEGVLDFVIFMALLSVNLGLINLFPIPVLDGGHIVIYLIEMITRREMNEKLKVLFFKLGVIIILTLMVFATWNDIVHLFKRWFS